MTRYISKAGLLAGASVLALGLAVGPNQANAFDAVSWNWDGQVDTNVTFDADIDVVLTPSGMAMIEDIQISIGDISAASVVSGISNNQPSDGVGGPVVVDLGTLQFTGQYDSTSGALTGNSTAPELPNEQFLAGAVNTASPFGVTANFDLGSIEVDFPSGVGGVFDALVELPSVVSAATAVANNTSINSEVSTQIHELQVAVGGFEGDNIDTSSPLGLLSGITPGQVSALSDVSDILNATVDSTATAVSNNLTVDVAAATSQDAVLIMDAQQWSFMDVSAVSNVSEVSVNSYMNLGLIEVPMVNSVATAIGNNKSINVSIPVVSGPTP